MKRLNEIKKLMLTQKEELRRKYNVKEIGIFGSYARDEQEETSDIDIFVSYEEIPGLLKFLELENYLTELLEAKVDLVRKEVIREELKETILNEAVAI
jgi:predicted nucleotidyltransferase